MKELISAEQLDVGIRKMAEQITSTVGDRPLTVIGVLTGSIVLLADLIRQLKMPLRIGFVQATSYRGGVQRGELELDTAILPDIVGQEVLLVDDIFDTGHTLNEVQGMIQSMEPGLLHTAVLLHKLGRQEVDIRPDFIAFEIPDKFVVGYGLDYRDQYRNLPYVAVLEEADLESNDPVEPGNAQA
ncbi:MAG: hypoxanthine phosphoribosyltransferase [Pirellulaceae bacterium]|nr:hypoxanthine phosphoribosyltransferase [Pirellulaceae bacterium]